MSIYYQLIQLQTLLNANINVSSYCTEIFIKPIRGHCTAAIKDKYCLSQKVFKRNLVCRQISYLKNTPQNAETTHIRLTIKKKTKM